MTLDTRLLKAMGTVPRAVGLAIAHVSAGVRGVLVIDATGEAFRDAERVAMGQLRDVQRLFRELSIDIVCVPVAEAEAIPSHRPWTFTATRRRRHT